MTGELMRWAARLLSLLVLVGLPVAAWPQPIVVESLTFDTNTPPRRPPTWQSARLSARLYLPVERSGPVSAIVITSSSGGVRVEREIFYAETLARSGMATLVIDSFGPRGVLETVTDQTRVSLWQMDNDAFAGLKQLRADARIKPDKIAVMGVSKGGGVALQSMFTTRQSWRGLGRLAFAAHVAIVPPCNFVHRSLATTGAPALLLLAEHDDQTPPAPCLSLAGKLRDNGHPDITAKVQKGAYHAWEVTTTKPVFNGRAENYSRCGGTIEDDGTVTMKGGRVRLRASEMFAWMKQNCMKKGMTFGGGTAQHRDQVAAEIVNFLKQRGF
jgi:dienelactone hydrolase